MIGLVLAVAIIALLMWYMNTHKTTFQPYVPPTTPPETTEILPPLDPTAGLPPSENVTPPAEPARDDLGRLIDELDEPKSDETVTPVIVRTAPTPPKNTSADPAAILAGAADKTTPAPSIVKDTDTTQGNDKAVLQIGSFTTRTQAEAQQAKLLMLDITTRIETAEVSGQTVYRVRSGSLSRTQAQSVQQRLNENQIGSIVLPQP